jgi:hypothetical protein
MREEGSVEEAVVETGGETRSMESRGAGERACFRVGEGENRLGNTHDKGDPNGEESSKSNVELGWLN